MPTIPRGEDLNVLVPSGQSGITKLDTRGVGAGMAAAGDALARAGSELQTKRVNYQYAQAEAEFLTSKIALDNAFDRDDEYSTIPDRYSTSLTAAVGKASSLITDPAARENFELQVQPRVAEGSARITDLAWNKEKDYQRGYVDDKLAQAREAVIQGDVDAGVGVAEAIIGTAMDMGYFGREEGVATLKTWQDGAVVAKIETLAPQEQLDALSQPWAGNIPTDVKIRLEQGAKTQLIQGNAQASVDDYLAKGYGRERARVEIKKITDAPTRAATERELDYQLSQQAASKSQLQTDLHNQYYLDIRQGRMRVENIEYADLYAMGPAITENLYAAQSRATDRGPAPPSNRGVLDKLFTLKAAGDPEELRQYFQDNWAQLDDGDFTRWSEVTTSEMIPAEVESILTMQDRIKGWSAGAITSKRGQEEATRTLTNKYDQWFRAYQQQNGKAPNDTESIKYFDSIVTEYDTGKLWKPDRPLYQLTDEQVGRVVQDIQKEDPAGYDTVLSILGIEDPNSEIFLQAYQRYANN